MTNKDKPLPILTLQAFFHRKFALIRLPTGLAAWGFVGALLVVYFIPYLFVPLKTLGIYAAVVSLPVTCAALLLAYRGSLLAWGCSFAAMVLFYGLQGGQLWSTYVFINLIFPNLLVLLIGLIVARGTSVSRTLRDLHHQLGAAHRELIIAHAAMQLQAFTDPLTGLPNHRAIMGQIDAEIQRCQTTQRNCAIIFADVDHFKHINDTWGHGAGDIVLSNIGHILQAQMRQEDFVGRYGGEEFAILITDIEQDGAYELAERLRRAIVEHAFLWESEETSSATRIPVTASFGLATYPLDGITRQDLIETADAAMYQAKHSGRNRVCLPGEECLELPKAQVIGDRPVSRENAVTTPPLDAAPFHDLPMHALRLMLLADATTRFLGRSEEEVMLIRLAAQLHDIGKIGVPEVILNKSSALTEEEWAEMHRYPEVGQQILARAGGRFQLISHIVVARHERWDGQGYPYRLAQLEIPLGARILSVVSSYDAMISARPYRDALSSEHAVEELVQGKGSQYDPEVVDAFLHVLLAQDAKMDTVSEASTTRARDLA